MRSSDLPFSRLLICPLTDQAAANKVELAGYSASWKAVVRTPSRHGDGRVRNPPPPLLEGCAMFPAAAYDPDTLRVL